MYLHEWFMWSTSKPRNLLQFSGSKVTGLLYKSKRVRVLYASLIDCSGGISMRRLSTYLVQNVLRLMCV